MKITKKIDDITMDIAEMIGEIIGYMIEPFMRLFYKIRGIK